MVSGNLLLPEGKLFSGERDSTGVALGILAGAVEDGLRAGLNRAAIEEAGDLVSQFVIPRLE